MSDSPFVGKWKITGWISGPVLESRDDGIPIEPFQADDYLRISEDPNTPDSFRLDWINQNAEQCSVSGLHQYQVEPLPPTLMGENLLTNFGARKVACSFCLNLTATALTELNGQIIDASLPPIFPSTASGTFTATANPDPPAFVEVGATYERISG